MTSQNSDDHTMPSPSLRSTVLDALRWTAIGRFSAQLFSWVTTIIVIRFLLPADYGLMAMVEVLYTALIMLTGAGIADGLIQQRNSTVQQERGLMTVLFGIGIGLAVIQWFTAPLVADWFNEPNVTAILRTLCIALLIQPWMTLPTALLKQQMRFKALSLIELGASVASAATTLTLAIAGFGVWSLIAGQLTNMVLTAIAICIVRRDLHLPGLQLQGLKKLIGFGAFVSATSLVWVAYSRLDAVIGGRFMSAAELGLYAVAMHLASLPMIKLMPLLHQVALPGYAQVNDDLVATRHFLRKSMRMVALLVFPVFLGLAAVAEPFIGLIIGENWLSTAIPLMLLCISMPLRMIAQLYQPSVRALGRADIPFGDTVITLVLLFLLLLILSRYGPIGLASAWLLSTPLIFVITHYRARKVLQLDFAPVLKDVLPPLICALLMAAITAVFVWSTAGWPYWQQLPVAVLIGAAVYLALIFTALKGRAREVLQLAGR